MCSSSSDQPWNLCGGQTPSIQAMAEAERKARDRAPQESEYDRNGVGAYISDNLRKLQQNGKQAELALEKNEQDEGAHAAQAQNGKHDEGAKVAEVQGRRGKIPAANTNPQSE
jgi:phage-related minor tail protein